VPAAAAPKTPAPLVLGAATGSTLQERIVFVSRGTAKREVWTVAPDGTGKRCLTPFAFEHWSPSLDPDGRMLACASRRATGVNLWLIDLTGGKGDAVTAFGEKDEVDAAWCAGGQRLVFLKGGKLWAVHRD